MTGARATTSSWAAAVPPASLTTLPAVDERNSAPAERSAPKRRGEGGRGPPAPSSCSAGDGRTSVTLTPSPLARRLHLVSIGPERGELSTNMRPWPRTKYIFRRSYGCRTTSTRPSGEGEGAERHNTTQGLADGVPRRGLHPGRFAQGLGRDGRS